MKVVIQRVKQASVSVDQHIVGQIEQGILAYVGIGQQDTNIIGHKMIDKILTYRIFANEEGRLDYNLQQINGSLLLVSQFTLLAKTDKGRRPDFTPTMPPKPAKVLFEDMLAYANAQHGSVASGEFGANMQVSAVNDGPINIILQID